MTAAPGTWATKQSASVGSRSRTSDAPGRSVAPSSTPTTRVAGSVRIDCVLPPPAALGTSLPKMPLSRGMAPV